MSDEIEGVRPVFPLSPWGDAEFGIEDSNDLSSRVARLNERAHDWATGKAGWFAKDYINGVIGVFLTFRRGVEADCITNQRAILDYHAATVPKAQTKTGDVGSVGCGRYKAMLVDVVCLVDAPEHIAERCASIAYIKGSDVGHDDFFEAIILPVQFVERTSPPALSSILTRGFGGEAWRDPCGFICERENGVVVGQARGSGQRSDKVVDRIPDIVDAIPHNERDDRRNWDLCAKVSSCLGQLTFEPLGVRVVLNHKVLPSGARLVGVYASPIEF